MARKEQVFWDQFIDKTIAYGVREKQLRWYVKHVEDYIDAYKDKRLKVHCVSDLEIYLSDLYRKPPPRRWYGKQVVQALKILFIEFVLNILVQNFGKFLHDY